MLKNANFILKQKLKQQTCINHRRGYRITSSLSSIEKSNAKEVPYESSLHQKDIENISNELPSSTDVVVIGGGVMGCSALYHLAKRIKGNVVLLEKYKLTSGTTWHTAGLFGRLRQSETDFQLVDHTYNLMTKILPEETGLETGWVNTGGLFVATSHDRVEEVKKLQTMGKHFNIESFLLKPEEVLKVHPLINTSDMKAGLYVPSDGTVDPAGTCTSYTRAACNYGAKVFEGCEVLDIQTKEDMFGRPRIASITTNFGEIKTNKIVNCTGSFAPFIGKMAGVNVPQLSYKHSYIVTESIEGVKNVPNVRSPEGTFYMKRQGDVLQIGGFEANPIPWEVEKDFSFGLFDLEWETIDKILEAACKRVPAFENSGIRATVVGPESFTADRRPLLGEALEVRGFYHCSAMNSLGMQLSGGYGKQMAHWVIDGQPELDMFPYDIRRFPTNIVNQKTWLKEKVHEAFSRHYSLAYPNDQPLAYRNQKVDPLYEKLLKKGCMYQERNAWERPSYFVENSKDFSMKPYDYYGNYEYIKHPEYPYREQLAKEYSFELPKEVYKWIGKESLTCRTSAAIFNMTSYGKLFLSGPDANAVAQLLFTKDVTKNKEGKCTYTLMLNKNGGVEADLIVAPMKDDKGERVYYMTVGAGVPVYCKDIVEKLSQDNKLRCTVEDRTDKMGILSIQGPNSLSMMKKIVQNQKVIEDLKFSSYCHSKIDEKDVIIMRVSFVGELGYEIHCDIEHISDIYDCASEIGKQYNATDAGFRAIHSMSTEVGFHHWPHTVRSDDNPFEANLGYLCSLNPNSADYVGKDILLKIKDQKLQKRLVMFTSKVDVPFYGNEIIWRNNEIVGMARSADFSFSMNKNVLHGYLNITDNLKNLDDETIQSGEYFIERMGRKYTCEAHTQKPFDTNMLRLAGKYNDTIQLKLKENLKSYS